MNTPPAPCRLSVYLSRKSRVGVILRRGPKTWTQLVHWCRETDTFTPGQWFHGHIDERRCDLSPNGELFIYFASKHKARERDDDVGRFWTAISRPPYFTALALWSDVATWRGGGIFKNDKEVLFDKYCGLKPHPKHRTRGLRVSHMATESAPCMVRLLRDKWVLIECEPTLRTYTHLPNRFEKLEIWEKRHPERPLTLYRQVEDADLNRYGGSPDETFWLNADGEQIPLPNVSWADWDTWDRLVFVRDGQLFSATVEDGTLHELSLFDLNPLQPENIPPPDWACRW